MRARNQTFDRRAPHLVERDEVLAMLAAAVQATPQHAGAGLLIAGETGTGKSALIRAALDAVDPAGDGATIRAYTSCHPSTIPYAPWIALIEGQPDLAESVPEPLGRRTPAAQGPEELVHQSARAIGELAETRPVVLVFDDIQWADGSSLDLMLAIARQLDGRLLTLLLTCETPLREGTPVAGFVPALLRETPVESVELHPLSREGIEQLVSERFPDPGGDSISSLVEYIRRWSGGNPLYVSEMLDGLEGSGGPPGTATPPRLDSLSFSLRQLAEYRLSQISDSARETLELAAIVGEVVDVDLLAEISGHGIDRLIDDLEQAIESGILIETRDNLVRFKHGVVRQMLAERQSGLRRRQRHRAVLEVLQRSPRVQPLDLARHAEEAGDYQMAVDAYERAGHQARVLFRMPEAGRYYRQALDLAEQANFDAARQDELRLQYADSIVRNDPKGAAREYERIAARAFVREDRGILAKARQRQTTLLYETGRRRDAQAILETLIPELEELEDWQTLADALTCALYCAGSASDFQAVDTIADQLEAAADVLSAPSYRAVADHTLAIANVARGKPGGAPIRMRDSIARALELGQLDIATPWTAVAFFRVDLFANLHRPAEVASLIERGMELDAESNRRIGLEPADCDCTPEFSYWWFLRGEWDRVREVLPDPIAIRSAPQPQVLKDSVQVIAAELAFAEGRYDDAATYLAYVAPSPGTPPGDHGYQQWLMAAECQVRLAMPRGELHAIGEWIDALDRELETKPHVPGELMRDLSRTRLHIAKGEAEEAAALANAVVDRARQTENMLALIDAVQLQARAYQLLGHEDPAMSAASEAVDVARQCDLGYLQSLARITHIEIARSFRDGSDRLQPEIDELVQQMEALGATHARDRLGKLSPRRRRGHPDGLTRREIEVLRFIVEGKTDNDIAEELFISHRTVGTHVGNMLNKTGTSNRVELATWALVNDVFD